MVVSKKIITKTNVKGKPIITPVVVSSAPKSAEKYSNYKIVLPKGRTSYKLYAISDVYINSRTTSRVELAKVKEYVNEIKKDPRAIVILNGNLFWFDDAIFGFDKGVPIADAFKVHYNNAERVKAELADMKKIEKQVSQENGEENNIKDLDEIIESKYAEMSEDAQVEYVLKKMKLDPNFVKSSFYKKHKAEIFYTLQKKAYEPYILDWVEILKPIKNKIAIINPGNEETKVDNFRQYNPLYDLAVKLRKQEIYSATRFWLLNITSNSYLTDNTNKTALYGGAYGIFNAETLTGLQSKINKIFKNFVALDGYIVTGYETNAWFKGLSIFDNAKGMPVLKPHFCLTYSGFRKVPETNQVRLKSYVVEREMNKNAAVLTYSRTPAYITKNLIGKNGRLLNFNEDFFVGQQLQTVSRDNNLLFVENFPIVPPYSVSLSLESIHARSQVVIDAEKDTLASKKMTGLAIYDMIVNKIKNAETDWYNRVKQINTENANNIDKQSDDFVKTFNANIKK